MADQITREEFADHMDAFEQRLGARISRTDRRLETVDSRLDAIDGRLDTIYARLDVIAGHLRGLSERFRSREVGDVEAAIDSPQPVLFPASGTSIECLLPEANPQPRPIRKANGGKVKSARGETLVASKRGRQRRRT